jgi:para-nitrobenzyl esterase
MSLRKKLVLLLVVALGIAAITFWNNFHSQGVATRLETRLGTLVGVQRGGVSRFLGIPYAQPPLGELRWKAPQPLAGGWQGELRADRFSDACVQGAKPEMARGSTENCLYLNVWRPDTPGKHAVMVWVHGGGLMLGSANEPQYSGEYLARDQNVVVVSMNYRLSYLGFLSTAGLVDDVEAVQGNQGFLDMIIALQWVHDNIADYNGDPGNVTIFGESGGGVASCVLLASPLSDGLIHKAIMQSGVCSALPALSSEQAIEQRDAFLRTVGCLDVADPLACARALRPSQIEERGITRNDLLTSDSKNFSFFPKPVIDGYFLRDEPMSALEQSVRRDVAVLLGTNKDEGSLFTGRMGFPKSEEEYVQSLAEMVPGAEKELSQLYPYADYRPIGKAYSQMFTDVMEVCPTNKVADAWSGKGPTFLYQFTQASSAPLLWLMSLTFDKNAADLGVYHGAEMPYVFGYNSIAGRVASESQIRTRKLVMDYWGSFARSGAPFSSGAPRWPPYTKALKQYLELKSEPQLGSALRNKFCQFWQQYPEFSFW